MTKISAVPPVQLPAQPLATQSLPAQSLPAQSLRTASRPVPSADPAKMAKSARDFESMAIGQLLQPMFDTVKTTNNAFAGGSGEEAWKPMLVQEFAKRIAAHGGLGLAKPVYDAMLRMQGTLPK